jgi:hypothetical protein
LGWKKEEKKEIRAHSQLSLSAATCFYARQDKGAVFCFRLILHKEKSYSGKMGGARMHAREKAKMQILSQGLLNYTRDKKIYAAKPLSPLSAAFS